AAKVGAEQPRARATLGEEHELRWPPIEDLLDLRQVDARLGFDRVGDAAADEEPLVDERIAGAPRQWVRGAHDGRDAHRVIPGAVRDLPRCDVCRETENV